MEYPDKHNGRFPGIAISKSVALPENLGFDYTRENASYIRVRNITLGYNLGPKELSVFKGYIRGIRVFVDFQNPLTFTNTKDMTLKSTLPLLI